MNATGKLRNIGPKSAAWLRQVGLRSLQDCHWQEVPEVRRQALVADAEAAIAQLPPPRGRPAAAPVTTTLHQQDSTSFDDERAGQAD